MNKLFIIAKKEFIKAVTTKAFIIITIIGPFLIAGLFVFQTCTSDIDRTSITKKQRTIKVIGMNKELVENLSKQAKFININLIYSNQDKEQLRYEVLNEKIDAYLVFPNIQNEDDLLKYFDYTYFTKEKNPIIGLMIEGFFNELIVAERLKKKNIDVIVAKKLLKYPKIKSINISDKGEQSQRDRLTLIYTIIGFAMLLYMTLIFYGQAIGRSVNVEKTSKTVEIMLSSVKPFDIMFGKILGLGFAGLLQYAIWFLMAIIGLEFILPMFGITAASINIEVIHFVYLIVFFVLAFFLYSSGYAALGAAAKDIHNMSQMSYPFILFLVISMVSVNVIIASPNSTFIQILSYFPFTSPVVMFGRTLVKMPSFLELSICISILIISIFGMSFIASKIFRVGILMTGKKVKFGEILKWITYK